MTILPTLTPDEHTRLYRLAKLFLVIGIVGSLLGILHNTHVRFDPGAERHYGHVTHVHIGGRDLAVPDEYFRGPRPHEAQSKQLYLWMMLPDYLPYDGELESGKDLESAWPRHLSVLIDDTAFTTDLQYRYDVSRNRYFRIPKDDGDSYGLHKANIYLKRPQDSQPAILEELYSETSSDGQIRTFIDCDRDDPHVHPHPMCANHEFQDGRLLYIIGYRKTNLPHWHDIEDRVHNLIESFSCVSKSNPNVSTSSNGAKPCPP
jgi:hypothetical protein